MKGVLTEKELLACGMRRLTQAKELVQESLAIIDFAKHGPKAQKDSCGHTGYIELKQPEGEPSIFFCPQCGDAWRMDDQV